MAQARYCKYPDVKSIFLRKISIIITQNVNAILKYMQYLVTGVKGCTDLIMHMKSSFKFQRNLKSRK